MGGGGISGQTTIQTKPRIINSIPNCNALYRKECWLCNRQDESFLKGQDAEFNLRLTRQGWKYLQIPGAQVIHKRETSLLLYAGKMFRYGRAASHIIKKHGLWGIKRYWYSVGITLFFTALTGLSFIALVKKRHSLLVSLLGCLYLLTLAATGILQIRKKSLTVCFMAIPVLLVQHISYTIGVIIGLISD